MFFVVALVISLPLGVMAKPPIFSILIGGAIGMLGFVSMHLPMIRGKFQTMGVKFVPMFIPMFFVACMWSAILYGIGRLFS